MYQYENKYSRKGDGMMKNRKTVLLGTKQSIIKMNFARSSVRKYSCNTYECFPLASQKLEQKALKET